MQVDLTVRDYELNERGTLMSNRTIRSIHGRNFLLNVEWFDYFLVSELKREINETELL